MNAFKVMVARGEFELQYDDAKFVHNRNFLTGYPIKPNNGVDVNSTYTNNIIMLMN